MISTESVNTLFESDEEDSIVIHLKINLLYLRLEKKKKKAANLNVLRFGIYKFFKKYEIYLGCGYVYSETLK